MSEAVARGSLVLSLDATELNRGLSKAGKDVKAKSDLISKGLGKDNKPSEFGKSLKGSATEKIGETFGGGSIAGMGAKAGLAGLAVAGVALLGKELYEAHVNLKQYAREMEAAERATEKFAETSVEKFDRIKERLVEFDQIAGSAVGIKANEAALADMRAELGRVSSALAAQEETEKSYDSKWASTHNMHLYLNSKLEETQKSEANRTKTLRAAQDQLTKSLEAQGRALANLKNPLANPEARKALAEFVKEQTDAVRVLEGLSQEELQLEKMRDKFGFADAQLGAARLAVAAKKAAENAKEAKEFIGQLEQDAGVTAKQDADDVKLAELIRKGADEAQIQRIRKLIELKKEQNKQYTPLQALERGTAAEISFQNKSKFEGERDKQVKAQLDELKKAGKILGDIRAGIMKMDRDPAEF